MKTLQLIKSFADQIQGYSFQYEDSALMNVIADDKPFPCIFFEEYREGSYKLKYGVNKSTRVQLYFMKLCPMHNSAEAREHLREEIETEAVMPFIELLRKSNRVERIEEFKFYTPPPRFDSNEVSIMLQFDMVFVAKCTPKSPKGDFGMVF